MRAHGHLAPLSTAGITAYDSTFTALDQYRGLRPAPLRFALAQCSVVELAKAFEGLRYPGLPFADAALDFESEDEEAGGTGTLYLRCADSPAQAERAAFAPLDLLYDPRRDVFLDPADIYAALREPKAAPRASLPDEELFQATVLLARQPYEIARDGDFALPRDFPVEAQRCLLSLVLTGPSPERAFELLTASGFLGAYWPELARLAGVGQSKEHHPEGDAWAHTMETFRHRKLPSLRLSLALLLHDAGKPAAESAEGRRFDRHAELGTRIAERFLTRLGFPRGLADDVVFLVRYHMMPAALPRLPMNRLEGVIDDRRFPILLELYKCDELSTFRGPDGYYEACAAYRSYLRNVRNPWRGADGKKLVRAYLEDRPRSSAPRKAAAFQRR